MPVLVFFFLLLPHFTRSTEQHCSNPKILHCVYVNAGSHFTVALRKDTVPFITLGNKTYVKFLGVTVTQ